MIYWFTGQPGHGKTVLASALKQELDNTFHIDGDDLRAIFDNKDYSEVGRRKNIELAQQLSHFLHNKGCNVVVSLVSPYQDQREEFKTKLGDSIKEFYNSNNSKWDWINDIFNSAYKKMIIHSPELVIKTELGSIIHFIKLDNDILFYIKKYQ